MARSPAHKLGQIIGEQLEAAIGEPLREIAEEFGLYPDYEHIRPARGKQKKVSWRDHYGNTHDLDYVLEAGRIRLAYCSYETIMQAFRYEELDMSSEEDTSQKELLYKVEEFERSTADLRNRVSRNILELGSAQFETFFEALRNSLRRCIELVSVLTLSGTPREFDSIADAVRFVTSHDESVPATGFVRYELNVRYSNGDEVRGEFREKENTIRFLRSFANR